MSLYEITNKEYEIILQMRKTRLCLFCNKEHSNDLQESSFCQQKLHKHPKQVSENTFNKYLKEKEKLKEQLDELNKKSY